jgi:hypothetical protein
LAHASSATGHLKASITIEARCTVVFHDTSELRRQVSDLERALAIHCTEGTPIPIVTMAGDQTSPCDTDPACSGIPVLEIEF